MMRKTIWIIALLALIGPKAWAFCGFYVAKADATLFNKSSQVILVRDGDRTTITMSNDFQGDVKDFAMVVPVPVVLQREQIKTVTAALFSKVGDATAPRLSAYYDENPCNTYDYEDWAGVDDFAETESVSEKEGTMVKNMDLGVKVEAKYAVGEYDILILSATESSGLETWLIQNGYKIPKGAKEVLDPYIKSNLKFFVVKVNMERHKSSGFQELTPLQITFDSPRFMLPIRLGMANANGDQDLIVYSFTRKGRVETTNYRLAEMPHDRDVPLYVSEDFGKFYTDAFDLNWKRQGRNAAMLEYAWDISGSQPVKCDPCPSPLLTYYDLQEAGVTWLGSMDSKWGYGLYDGDLFVTRMHIRYNRTTFPQDLAFQETPNRQNFQCRYVIHYPASGDFSCDEGQKYLRQLRTQRWKEIQEAHAIAGWTMDQHTGYLSEYDVHRTHKPTKKDLIPVNVPTGNGPSGPQSPLPWLLAGFGLLGMGLFLRKIMDRRLRRV